MHKILMAGLLMGLLALTALAADVTGKWTAQMPGRNGQTREATFNLKADGNTLTGNVSGPRGDGEIADGRIEDDHISFTQTMEFGGNTVKLLYKGTVAGDEIRFTRKRDGGQGKGQEFVARRSQ